VDDHLSDESDNDDDEKHLDDDDEDLDDDERLQRALDSIEPSSYEEPWKRGKVKYTGPTMPLWMERRPYLHGQCQHHPQTQLV
jgi:hypothetical protein